MPLHDWSTLSGWEGVHDVWIVELLRWVKPRLPEGYRAYIGSTPALSIGAPDVSVRDWSPVPALETSPPPLASSCVDAVLDEPDEEVAAITLDPSTALFVASRGRLIAAVELISPRNKDRPSTRAMYLARYLGYMLEGAHLLLVDVHPRPAGFSFPDALAQELRILRAPCPPPCAVSYRVGERAASGGRMVGIWQRTLVVGSALPTMQLPLTVHLKIPVDLEPTYTRAAADAYLS